MTIPIALGFTGFILCIAAIVSFVLDDASGSKTRFSNRKSTYVSFRPWRKTGIILVAVIILVWLSGVWISVKPSA